MARQTDIYPTCILPRQGYKVRLDVAKLIDNHPNLIVVRQIKGTPEDYGVVTAGGSWMLRENIFDGINMANLSVNLAGGLFDTDKNAHLRFLPANTDSKNMWNGEQVNENILSNRNDYKIVEPCFGLCLYVSKIHTLSFPYCRYFRTQQDYDNYCQAVKDVKGVKKPSDHIKLVEEFCKETNKANIYFQIKVNHRPTKANYWHMTIDIYPPHKKDCVDPNDKLSSQDAKMIKSLRHSLLSFVMIDYKPEYKISSKEYLKICYRIKAFFTPKSYSSHSM